MNPNAEFIKPDDCLLLMVDIQETFISTCINGAILKKNAISLTDTVRAFGIPVLLTTQYADKLGGVDPDLAAAAGDARVIDKLAFSAFDNDDLRKAVAAENRKTILLCGMETHICIFHTALGALHLGYRVHVAADAVSSPKMIDWKVGLKRMEHAGAVISSTEMIIFELLHRAGTAQFKALLPVLKALSH